jgi:hypothetical protein
MNSNDIQLYGGRFPVTAYGEFLAQWENAANQRMTYAVSEMVSAGIDLLPSETVIFDPDDILRLHLFGAGGDLTVRWDVASGMVYWRYIGQPLPKDFSPSDFGGKKYSQKLERDANPIVALLWGAYSPGRERWAENRVGKAKLDYPYSDNKEQNMRLMVQGYPCCDRGSGEIMAIWTTGFVKYQQEDE